MARNPHKKTIVLFLSFVLVAACTATISPEWTRIYNHKADVQSDRLAWLEDIDINSYGDVIVAGTTVRAGLENRVHDLVLTRFTEDGQRLWARDFDLATADYRSDDSAVAMAIDDQDNIYVLVNQFRAVDDSSSSAAWLISTTADGNERWRRQLSDREEMHALTLSNNKLYATGPTTQVINLDGKLLQRVEHSSQSARSIQANANGQFVTGGGQAVSLYSTDGQRLWRQADTASEWAAGEVIFTMNGDIVATNLLEENGAARITRYSAQGDKLWSRSFSAAHTSYGLPGPALVFEDYRGDLWLTASNADGHRIVKLDSSGREIWNKTSRKGIVKDAALRGSDLLVAGGGYNAMYTSDGSRVAESKIDRNVQITTGSIAIDGDKFYAGYSAEDNGTFAFHLSQYLDR